MARTITITTTVTKTIGQIAYEATDPSVPWSKLTPIERDRWEAIAEAVAKALDAERATTTPHVRLTPLTHDPQQPLPVWPGEIVQAPGPKEWPPRPGYSPHGDPLMSAVVSSAGGETAAEFQSNGSITFATTGDISGLDGHWNNPGGKR